MRADTDPEAVFKIAVNPSSTLWGRACAAHWLDDAGGRPPHRSEDQRIEPCRG